MCCGVSADSSSLLAASNLPASHQCDAMTIVAIIIIIITIVVVIIIIIIIIILILTILFFIVPAIVGFHNVLQYNSHNKIKKQKW